MIDIEVRLEKGGFPRNRKALFDTEKISLQDFLNRPAIRIRQFCSQDFGIGWRLMDNMAAGKDYIFPNGGTLSQKNRLWAGIGKITVGGGSKPIVLVA